MRPGQEITQTQGPYGREREIFQAFVETRVDDQHRLVIGSWIVGDKAAGMILREGEGDIITGDDRVVPHFFE